MTADDHGDPERRLAPRRAMSRLAALSAAVTVVAACSASRVADTPPATVAPGTGPAAATTAVASEATTNAVTTDSAVADGSSAPSSSLVVETVASVVVPETLVAPGIVTTIAPVNQPSAATLAPTVSPIPPPSPEQWAVVDTLLNDELVGRGDFAVSYAVSIDGAPVHAAAFGVRNSPDIVPPAPEVAPAGSDAVAATTLPPPPPAEAPQAPTTDTRFRIASISKVITGTVVLQLVEDGTLQLDQPVGGLIAQHLGVDVTGRPFETVTVRQLLSHTAGFDTFRPVFFGGESGSCRESAIAGITEGLRHDPGTTYHYSNMSFCVLQQLIEATTGQDYQTVVYERLLTPLGITGMRLAGTFDPDPGEAIHPSFPGRRYMEALGGAGAWMATPADVVTIIDSLDNSKPGFHPLSAETTELMRQPLPGIEYGDLANRWYGMAMIVFANKSWGHSGTVENTHAMVIHRPDGMTWSIIVSGNHPENSDELIGIFQSAVDQSGIQAPAPTTTTTTTTTLPPPPPSVPPVSGPPVVATTVPAG